MDSTHAAPAMNTADTTHAAAAADAMHPVTALNAAADASPWSGWWPAFLLVALLGLVAALVDGRGRLGSWRRPRRTVPRPGEIWWAEVPSADGVGGGDRPCLVLRARGGTVRVITITGVRRPGRADIALPPGAVGDGPGGESHRGSYLETDGTHRPDRAHKKKRAGGAHGADRTNRADGLRELDPGAFRRRAGRVGPGIWEQVRHLGS